MFIDDMWTVELVMKMFVNTSGVPFNSTKLRPDGRMVDGTERYITSHPYQVGHLLYSSIWRYVWDIWTKQTACVCNDKILVVKTYLKNRYMNQAVVVCSSGGIVDWTEENCWFCTVICCFINCIAVSLHVGLLLRIV
jgi:Fe-S cluster biosynthesis and repair protein YggX